MNDNNLTMTIRLDAEGQALLKALQDVELPRVYLPEGLCPWCRCGSRFWWRTAKHHAGWYNCESCNRSMYCRLSDDEQKVLHSAVEK